MSGIEGRDPYEDYLVINKELEKFSPKLLQKPMIIIANKMDMESAKENLKEFQKKVDKEIYPISALTNDNLNPVLIKLADLVDKEPNTPLYDEENYLSHVLYKFENEKPFTIEKENDYYVIHGKQVEKMFKMTNFQSDEGIERFIRQLRKLGIDEELEKMNIEDGSIVKILDYEFEYRK